MWLHLLPAVVACTVGAWLTFQRGYAAAWWFPWAFAGLSVYCGLAYGHGVRLGRTPGEVFVFSLVWDVVVTAVYVVVPLAVCGVRLTPAGWVGLAMVAGGMLLLKAFGTTRE